MGLLNDSIDAGTMRRSWAESHWLWDLYVAGGCLAAICAVFVLNNTGVNDTDLARRFGAAAAIVALFVWYLAVGRVIIRTRPPGPRAWVFVAGVVVLFAVALLLSTNTWAVVPVVYPLLFMSLTLRSALALTTVVNVLPLAAVVLTEGIDSDSMPITVVLTVLALLISPAIGTWITKTVEQSEERAQLLDELAASRAESSRLSRAAGTAAERARLAREIHDTLAQGFTSIVALSQAIESKIDANPEAARRHIALIADTARENLAEARAMVAALTPSAAHSGFADRCGAPPGREAGTGDRNRRHRLGAVVAADAVHGHRSGAVARCARRAGQRSQACQRLQCGGRHCRT